MRQYELYFFDFDGTLVDTSKGVHHCFDLAAQELGMAIGGPERFEGVIGGPLKEGFSKGYGVPEHLLEQAVALYRKYYSEVGIHECQLYPGIIPLLKLLKEQGKKIAVATLKQQVTTEEMLNDFHLLQYMDGVYGPDAREKDTKASLLERGLEDLKVEKEKSVLVGDSIYDAQGAQQVNMDFIGVTYGLGFHNIEEIKQGYYTYAVENLDQIQESLISK